MVVVDDETIVRNAVGTCLNVLLDEEHPDAEELRQVIRRWDSNAKGLLFDLRYRRLDGSRFCSYRRGAR